MTVTKKKIIWLAHEANLSGANIAMLEYVDVLKDDYDFHIILPHEGTMLAAFQKINIPTTIIHQYGWAGKKGNWIKRLKILYRTFMAVTQTKQLIRKVQADIVFTNTLVPFTAAKAAHQLHKPHVWFIHEFGEEDFGFTIGWGKPELAYAKMTAWSKLIICNSNAVAKKFSNVMPAAIVKRLYQPVSWHSIPVAAEKKNAKFLMFGQLTSSKGHVEVLKAIAALKKEKNSAGITLHIKGPCENQNYLNELLQLIAENELHEEIQIETGFFQKEEVMPFYEALIVASRAEAFGRVIVEANKAGLKVIVKNNGGATELINETNGILYHNEKELEKILSGEISLPNQSIRLNYSEAEEIKHLKTWLADLA